FVDDPGAAVPAPGAAAALERLAALPRTTVALLSGRNRAALAAVSGAVAPVELVGSHGSEWESGFDRPPGADDEVVLSRLRGALAEIVTRAPRGARALKPTSA